MSTMDEICHKAGCAELRRLVDRLTDAQSKFFDRIFPKGIDAMDLEKLATAIALCERTLVVNQHTPEEDTQ